jgi:lipid-binding SYLF domain-containing protein
MTLIMAGSSVAQKKKFKAEQTVDKARLTVQEFQADSNFTHYYDGYLKQAKGLLIVPQLVKGGFIVGGSGGSGVLLARDAETGEWTHPAFYTLGGVSFGLQAGGAASQVLVIVTNERGLNRLLNSGAKLGADLSVAVGPVGEGIGPGNITADLIVFSKNKGLYGGVSVEGSVVDVRDSWNAEYYGERLRASDILVRGKGAKPQASELIAAVAKLTSGAE